MLQHFASALQIAMPGMLLPAEQDIMVIQACARFSRGSPDSARVRFFSVHEDPP